MAKEVERQVPARLAHDEIGPLATEKPPLTRESVGSFIAAPKGSESFMADQDVSPGIASALQKTAEMHGIGGIQAEWTASEMMKNAAQHGLCYSPKDRVAVSWDFASETPHLQIANRGSELFNPLKYIDLKAGDIQPDESEGYIHPTTDKLEFNTHVGLQVALNMVDRIEYGWDFRNGDKVRAVARMLPEDKGASMDAKLIPREGAHRPIDLDHPPEMGRAERFSAKVFLKKS